MTVTKEQIVAALQTIQVVADLIRLKGSIPSGHLYAELCGVVSLDLYQSVITRLKGAGLVRESGHLLTWIGPPAEVVTA